MHPAEPKLPSPLKMRPGLQARVGRRDLVKFQKLRLAKENGFVAAFSLKTEKTTARGDPEGQGARGEGKVTVQDWVETNTNQQALVRNLYKYLAGVLLSACTPSLAASPLNQLQVTPLAREPHPLGTLRDRPAVHTPATPQHSRQSPGCTTTHFPPPPRPAPRGTTTRSPAPALHPPPHLSHLQHPQLHHGPPPMHHAPPPAPVRQSSSNSQSASSSRRGSQAQGQYSDSESEGEDDKVERDKLEIRREKNRVKQRNLRLRRANHIADLERDVSTLKSESSSLSSALALSHAREASLQGWIHDLESVLFRNGLAGDVEGMRRVWAERGGAGAAVGAGAGGRRGSGYPIPPQGMNGQGDPLSTLARAASQQTPTYPHPHHPSHAHAHAHHQHPHHGHPTMQMPDRPTLPRPGSFSKSYENPYPTPDVVWPAGREPDMSLGAGAGPAGSSLSAGSVNAGPGAGEPAGGGKRKRTNEWEPYGLAGTAPAPSTTTTTSDQPRSASYSHPAQNQQGQQQGQHTVSRRSDSSLNTLPPIHALPGNASPSSTSASAAVGSFFPPGASADPAGAGEKTQGEDKVSPRLIRISDLVSPSHAGETFWGHGEVREVRRDSGAISPKQMPTDPLRLPPFRLQGSTSSTASTTSSAGQGHGHGHGHELPTPLSEMRA